MARQPEVFVRALEPAEAQRLVKIARTARDRVRLRRAGIVLASVQGRSAAEAAAMFAATPQYAREVIHAFNEQGFAALDPKWSGGRPRRFGPVVRELVCRVAKTAPQQLGRPFTTWSLSKLAEHLGAHHRVVISTETVQEILREAGISWQATKTWKGSRDPEFAAKMTRVVVLLQDRVLRQSQPHRIYQRLHQRGHVLPPHRSPVGPRQQAAADPRDHTTRCRNRATAHRRIARNTTALNVLTAPKQGDGKRSAASQRFSHHRGPWNADEQGRDGRQTRASPAVSDGYRKSERGVGEDG